MQIVEKEITKEEALSAYNALIDYCSMQGGCGDCLLAMEENDDGIECVMQIQDEPRGWDVLELDQPCHEYREKGG